MEAYDCHNRPGHEDYSKPKSILTVSTWTQVAMFALNTTQQPVLIRDFLLFQVEEIFSM